MKLDNIVRPGQGTLARLNVTDLIEDGDAKTFEYTDRLGQPGEGFIMRWAGELVAYENRCPHWSVPVGFDDDEFVHGRDIICPMHGARFNPTTGVCWSGPCIGDGLEKFEIDLDGDDAVVRRVRPRIALL